MTDTNKKLLENPKEVKFISYENNILSFELEGQLTQWQNLIPMTLYHIVRKGMFPLKDSQEL